MEHVRLGRETTQRVHDVVVVGAGVAGMSVASGLAGRRVALLTRGRMATSGSSPLAQGGVAAAWGPDDSPRLHAADTLAAGAGLSQPAVVEALTRAGVPAIRSVIDRGARFDHAADGALLLGREGAHSRPRIVHAGGDATGAELVRALGRSLRRQAGLEVVEDAVAEDLALHGDEVVGVVVRRGAERELHLGHVVLATGGFGHLYRYTTNPPESRGDGLALAARAGAVLADLEFVQFHPTTLYVAGAERFLITEAARGEGGVLVDARGDRFMPRFHPLAELAPRDVVSRAISTVMRETGSNRVFLDLSPVGPDRIRHRFPQILEKLRSFGIDILTEPIPVRPSAHYSIGGVRTDLQARTSVEGLFAAGEVAATGLHGANRLASNSLLEGLVFGHRAGRRASEEVPGTSLPRPFSVQGTAEPVGVGTPLDLDDLTTSLRSLLWQKVGLERDGEHLRWAFQQICSWIPYGLGRQFREARSWGVQNMLLVAFLLTYCAERRQESRGVHFRVDYPQADDENWKHHAMLDRRAFEG